MDSQSAPGDVRAGLDRILASPSFLNADRASRLLRFLVEEALAGRAGTLKEYLIGVEVFGRGSDYDPREDAIVRLEARRLRDRLREYYAAEGQSESLVINVPKGGYAPVFSARANETPTPAAPPPLALLSRRRPRWVASAAVVVALAVVAVFVAFYLRRDSAQPAYLAVLPVKNLTGESRYEYFTEGLTEELSAWLAMLDGVRVIARASSVIYRDSAEDVPAMGRKLGVKALVRGSLQRSGNLLRINVQLVETASGQSLWAQSFDRPVDNWFAAQDEVRAAVVEAVRGRLAGARPLRHSPAYAGSRQAQQLYWQARYLRQEGSPGNIRKAIALYEEAIALDSRYAAPYAALGNACAFLAFHELGPKDELARKAKAAAEQAIRFDETLSEGHRILAWLAFFYEFDWPTAEREFGRAIELNPSAAGARNSLALALMSRGRFDEAILQAREAVRLNPLSFLVSNDLGVILYAARRYPEAAAHAEQVLKLSPDFNVAYYLLGVTRLAQGRAPEAADALRKALGKRDFESGLSGRLGYALAVSGRPGDARAILAAARAQDQLMDQAFILTALGDRPAALSALEQAAARRETDILFAGVEPLLDPLRSEPRFQALMARLGLPGRR